MKKLVKQEHKLDWSPIGRAVDMALIDDYDDAQVMRQRYFHWAIRGYRKLNLTLLRIVQDVILPVNEKTGCAVLPHNYRKWSLVGSRDHCGEIRIHGHRAHVDEVEETVSCKCGASTSGCTICDQAIYELLTEDETIMQMDDRGFMRAVVYQKTTKKFFDKTTGYYTWEIQEPVLIAETGVIEMQTRIEQKCRLKTAACGCIRDEEENREQLYACGCMCSYLFGHPGLHHRRALMEEDEWFEILEDAGLIRVREGITHVYLKYIASAPMVNGEMWVPTVSLDTLAAYVLMKRDQRRSLPDVAKERSRQIYLEEKRDMKKAMIKIRLSVIHNAINLIPHG